MDKRSESRVAHNIRFFVHVHECEEDPDMVGVSVTCEAVDFSTHGLQFQTDQELITGTLVNITIGIGEPFAMFLLRGEVRWVRPMDDEFAMGILLQEAEGTDIDLWRNGFEERFAD